MPLTDTYKLISITAPSTWLAVVLAFIIAGLLLTTTQATFRKSEWSGWLDLFFWLVVMWKLSYILIGWKTIIHQPLSLLYFNGGAMGWILGIIVTLYVAIRKLEWSVCRLIPAYLYLLAVYQISMAVLNDATTFNFLWTTIGFGILLLAGYFIPWERMSKKFVLNSASLLPIIHTVLAWNQPLGLSQWSLATTWLVCASFVALLLLNRKEVLQ